MSWRASPAAARSLETSTSSSKARVTSPLVSALKRARSTWSTRLGFASKARDNASTPISSPSRSKSVAITTLSAFLERERTASATPFSETDFWISASIRLEGSTFCQLEYSSGYSGFRTCPLRPTETHSSSPHSKVWCGTERCLPSFTCPSARNWAIFLAAFAFSEIISRILSLFITHVGKGFHPYKVWDRISNIILRLGVRSRFGDRRIKRFADYTPREEEPGDAKER